MAEKPTHIDFKYNLRLYFGLLKKYKGLFFVLIISILIVEAINAAHRFLFKVIVDDGTAFFAGTMTKEQLIGVLMTIAAIFIAINIIKYLLKWLNIYWINRLDGDLIFELKKKFFNHIVTLSHSFHTTHRTGSLISRLTRGGRAIEKMTDLIVFSVFPTIFQAIIVISTIAFFDTASAIVLFVTSIVFLAYSYIFQRIQQPSSIAANDTEDFEKGNISDIFTNIDSIKYFGKEDYIKKKYMNISTESKKAAVKNWDYYRWIDSGQSIIVAIGTFFMMYFPLIKFLNNELTIGTLVLIYTMFGMLIDPLFRFVWSMREYYMVMADFESLFEYNKIEREVKDKNDAPLLTITKGEVKFEKVTFNYGARQIFNNFNLKVPANKKVALVGHSGSGKSTLVKLIYRLYDINDGRILIDGIDIRDVSQESLRSEMSIVPQECILFDDSIYNNIAFSRPEATKEEVMDAIRFAQLDKIIQEFPKKEETIVGERGVKLSGGEKQRVSIARAILANKKILVLDEATSSLDSETEYEIQKDFEKLMKDRTTIIIAHRLSTIMKADKIIVMKKGAIVQAGNHKQLIKRKGEYKKLWNLQKGGYIK
jgi:ATP-binding cassette subfamily B protein